MKLFKTIDTKTKAGLTKSGSDVRTLSAAELDAVSGGINPQPLPPGRAQKL